jgi:hypothetical protein
MIQIVVTRLNIAAVRVKHIHQNADIDSGNATVSTLGQEQPVFTELEDSQNGIGDLHIEQAVGLALYGDFLHVWITRITTSSQ